MTAPSPRTVLPVRDQVDILIVDDRLENLIALEAMLEPLGQRLVQARSGEEALRKLPHYELAVVILEVQMAGMSGFETAQLIKARERTRHTPIIFLSAVRKEEDHASRGYQVGAVDYISRPFQPDALRAKVAVFVDLYLEQKRMAEQQSLLHESELRTLEVRHIRELLESETKFREIVGTAMDAIVIFDGQERITLFNGAAERMFSCAAAAAIGHEVTQFIQGFERSDTLRDLCATASRARADAASPGDWSGMNRVAPLTGRRRNGEAFPVEASISCFEGRDGQQYTLIVRDISERIRQEEELRLQAETLERTMAELQMANEELGTRQEELERAMTARSRFYASMSHELRTPINAVLGYSTLLLENIYGALNEKQTEGIQRAQRAAKHLLELVNDVLDLSKIEAGKIDLRLQPMTFPGIVEELFVTVRPLADKHGTKLSLETDGRGSTTIVSDPRRVRQILLNLLSNAIKFGGSKPIRVRVERTMDEGISVAVIDHGEGIPPEDRERIFQEFVQLGKTQLQEGTGLGLPISKRLADLLDGSLTLESEVGKGSTFKLTLPANAEMHLPRISDQERPLPASREEMGGRREEKEANPIARSPIRS